MFALRTLSRRSAPALRLATQQRAMSGIAVNNVSRIAKFKARRSIDSAVAECQHGVPI